MIELALIGAGKWGKNYINTIAATPGAHLKYVCNSTTASLDKLDGDFTKTTDSSLLLGDEQLDGVIIATPPASHFEIAKAFMKRRQNLLIEKPLTTNFRQAKQLVNYYDPRRSVVMVGHTMLFHPAFQATKKLLPTIGQIRYALFEGMNYGPIRDDYSALWDWGPHGVAMILDLFQSSPNSIAAWGINPLRPNTNLYDLASIRLQYSDFEAYIQVSWLSPVKKRQLTIVGSASTLLFDDLSPHQLTLFQNTNMPPTSTYPKLTKTLPLTSQISQFVKAIKHRSSSTQSDLSFGLEVTRILSIAEQSAKAGGKIIHL